MVREIMVPRVDIVALDVKDPLAEVIKTIIDHGLSRIPLYQDTIDEVVGVVYAKDLLRLWGQSDSPVDLKEIARKPHFVPETKRVDELLQEFREKRVHMAIVVDEYGGVAGLVSLEDLMEEIVGEIEDEFDIGESHIDVISPTEVVADARVSIGQLNEALSLAIEGDDFRHHRWVHIPPAGQNPQPRRRDAVQRGQDVSPVHYGPKNSKGEDQQAPRDAGKGAPSTRIF